MNEFFCNIFMNFRSFIVRKVTSNIKKKIVVNIKFNYKERVTSHIITCYLNLVFRILCIIYSFYH